MYVTIHPTFTQGESVVKYNKTEIVSDVRRIKHPIARQVLIDHKLNGVEIVSTGDIPSGTGLSTSSAYTVGLIHAVYAYEGKYCSQERIAREACEMEIEKLGEPIGKQDQYGTAIGGLKMIKFLSDDTVEVEPVIIKGSVKRRLNNNLLLFYTGLTHSAGEILKEQGEKVAEDGDVYQNLLKMTQLAYDMREALTDGDLNEFGEILNANWELKRSLTGNISNDFIDEYYQIAIKNGALGGKLLGAGGGGFLLFYCPEEKQARLRCALSDLVELPFSMENSGTKIIYVGEKDWDK